MLGIYSMTTSSEQTVARDSREAIEELADRKGEVLDARIKDNTILIDSHAQQESKIFMIDFVMEDDSTERVMYSQEGAEFDDFIPKDEVTRMRTNAPEIGAGEVSSEIDLNDFGLEQSKIKSASFLTENGNRFIIDVPEVALLGVGGGDGSGGGDGVGGGGDGVDGLGDGTRATLGMLSTLSSNMGMIQVTHDAKTMYGTGMFGEEITPQVYIYVDDDTDFASLIHDTDTEVNYVIPEFHRHYLNLHDTLSPIDEGGFINVIGAQSSRTLTGDAVAKITPSGIVFSGTGTVIVKLNDHAGQEMLMRGTGNGDKFQIVTSPYDLMTHEYVDDLGYHIMDIQSDPGLNSFESVAGIDSTHTGTIEFDASARTDEGRARYGQSAHGNVGIAGDDNDGVCNPTTLNTINGETEEGNKWKTSIASYWHGNGYTYRWSNGCSYVLHSSIVDVALAKENKGDHYIITGHNEDTPPFWQKGIVDYGLLFEIHETPYPAIWMEACEDRWPEGCNRKSNYHPMITDPNFQFNLYDTLPSKQLAKWTSPFEKSFTFPSEQVYLHAELNGGDAKVFGASHSLEDDPFLSIDRLTPDTPYRIFNDGMQIIRGMSSPNGEIIIDDYGITAGVGGVLKTYPDSMKYRGQFSTMVFDGLNDHITHIDGNEKLVYTVYAYAVIDVTSPIRVTGLSLDGILLLSHLLGEYNVGDTIHIPIIAGYKAMHLEINGIPTVIKYSSLPGITGVTVAEPTENTTTDTAPVGQLLSSTSTAGVIVYTIVGQDGMLNAIISERVEGDAEITHEYKIWEGPNTDRIGNSGSEIRSSMYHFGTPYNSISLREITGHADVYVNGKHVERIEILGDNNGVSNRQKDLINWEREVRGISECPSHLTTTQCNGYYTTCRRCDIVTFSNWVSDWEVTTLSTFNERIFTGIVSVPVKTGDFVEIYVSATTNLEVNTYVPREPEKGCRYGSSQCNTYNFWWDINESSSSSTATTVIKSAYINTDIRS